MQSVDAGGMGIGDGYPPRVMGVLNVSEESPYDPSVFTDPQAAARYVDESLIDEGADIVDVGLESANKRFDVLSADEELERLDLALEILERVSGDAVFSIETRYAAVADAALAGGFDLVNDICGFADTKLPEVCADHGVPAVKMAGPGELDRPGAVETVDDIYDALAADPLPRDTIVDPAFGGWSEGKSVEVDRETFHRLREFQALDRPMLVSINRKNFLRHLADRSTTDALPVSLAATAMAVERGAHVLRTHDVAATRDAAIIGDAFRRDRLNDVDHGIRELDVTNDRELARHLDRIGASRTAAVDGTFNVLELSTLDDVERSLAQSFVGDTNCQLVGKQPAIIMGTTRGISQLHDIISGEAPELVAALDAFLTST